MTVSTRYRFDGLSAHHRVRQSGTVLILVVVILALMALIGVAYIQVSRTTLMASKKPISGLDAACHSVVGQIQTTLLKDLYSDGTKLFDASKYLSPYDYPWTNSANDWPTSVTNQEGIAFATQPKGGRFDDAWLASSCPTFSPDTTPIVTWPHITNLNGIFLQIPALGAASGTDIVEDPINFSGHFTKTDTNLLLDTTELLATASSAYETYGADADGDGILDSRWTWTPLRRFGNLVYVCAVRIIDNSSMINVNTATSLTKDGGTLGTTADTRPRGYYPSDVDLSRLLYAGSGSWSSDLNALYTYRNVANGHTTDPTLMGLASLPSTYPAGGYGAAGTRSGTWFLNGQYYGKETGGTLRGIYYNISDELELRYKNGLNNSNSGTVNIKTQMPNLTRSAATTETYYGNVSGVTADTAGQAFYFQGGPPATHQDVEGRSFPEVRKMLTTRSGASAYSNNPNRIWNSIYSDWAVAVPSTERFLKYDLLYQGGGGRGTDADNLLRAQRIGSVIHAVFSLGAASGKGYLGTVTPADSDLLTQIATEYMLAIKDYNDSDNVPSMVQIGGTAPKYYGIEPILPFIREVYVQTAFTGSDNYTTFSPALGPSDTKADTWTHAGSASDCFVIELGNPFDRQINCDNVQLVIGGATYNFPASTTIDARSHKIFYVTPSSDANDRGYDYPTDTFPDPLSLPGSPIDLTSHRVGAATLNLSDGNPIEAKLQVDVDSTALTDYVVYDRLTGTTFTLSSASIIASNTTEQDDSSATIGRHRQARLTRACDSTDVSTGGVHYLSNKKQVNQRTLPTNSDYLSNTNLSKFDSNAKGVTGDAKLDGFMMPVPNRPFFSVAELGKILMVGFTDEATGDLPQRLSGADGTGGFLNGTGSSGTGRLFLDFSTTATVPAATTTWPDPMPHAAMLLNEFTTLSPAYDGVDNTTAASGDPSNATDGLPSEQFVPGLININTAPLHVATLACPLPESINDIQDLMAAIVHYRDSSVAATRATLTGLASTDMRANSGIASLAELMYLKPSNASDVPNNKSSSVSTATLSMQRYAQDNTDNKGEAINLYPMPEDGGTAVTAIDGANEKLSRFQFLSQVYTTRSDIFTAYVVVRGYRDNDYGKGPVESATFIAVFDRSGVTSSSGTVKLLAYQRIN